MFGQGDGIQCKLSNCINRLYRQFQNLNSWPEVLGHRDFWFPDLSFVQRPHTRLISERVQMQSFSYPHSESEDEADFLMDPPRGGTRTR